ncbi:hypothetical protein SK128_013487 [Halocaridina rubra]|uniref:Uncharacterized protein n=1 Tax=Halocaridina rubra TaxID=373956 RepID=A0AAN8WSL5_HALRR
MSRTTLAAPQSPTLSPPVSLHSPPQVFSTFTAAPTPTLTTSSLNMNGLTGGGGLGSLSPQAVSPHSPNYSPHHLQSRMPTGKYGPNHALNHVPEPSSCPHDRNDGTTSIHGACSSSAYVCSDGVHRWPSGAYEDAPNGHDECGRRGRGCR